MRFVQCIEITVRAEDRAPVDCYRIPGLTFDAVRPSAPIERCELRGCRKNDILDFYATHVWLVTRSLVSRWMILSATICHAGWWVTAITAILLRRASA